MNPQLIAPNGDNAPPSFAPETDADWGPVRNRPARSPRWPAVVAAAGQMALIVSILTMALPPQLALLPIVFATVLGVFGLAGRVDPRIAWRVAFGAVFGAVLTAILLIGLILVLLSSSSVQFG